MSTSSRGSAADVPLARLGGRWASGLREVSSDVGVLDGSGRWAVAIPFDGEPVLARFEHWTDRAPVGSVGRWRGPGESDWVTSMDSARYIRAVERTRTAIAAGSVYQANVCRILAAAVPDAASADVAALSDLLDAGNPAPYGGFLRLPERGVAIASASPELFLQVTSTSAGRRVRSGPIKGTGRVVSDMTEKDAAENVMIVDLVRNDLSRVSQTGSVVVPDLLRVEHHPGLVHLVSYVEGLLVAGVTWAEILAATFPPGSVTGAPKLSALDLIDRLEPAPREFYCGAFGWVDADEGTGVLAVAIRTFWLRDDVLRFGTGAGITWGSQPAAEWEETELKAARLVGIANGTWQGGPP